MEKPSLASGLPKNNLQAGLGLGVMVLGYYLLSFCPLRRWDHSSESTTSRDVLSYSTCCYMEALFMAQLFSTCLKSTQHTPEHPVQRRQAHHCMCVC